MTYILRYSLPLEVNCVTSFFSPCLRHCFNRWFFTSNKLMALVILSYHLAIIRSEVQVVSTLSTRFGLERERERESNRYVTCIQESCTADIIFLDEWVKSKMDSVLWRRFWKGENDPRQPLNFSKPIFHPYYFFSILSRLILHRG